MSAAQRITAALGGRWTGGHGIARCPAHEDRQPSLSLSDGTDGRLLVKCHAGCAFDAIRAALRALGLEPGSGPRRLRDVARDMAARFERDRDAARRSAQAKTLWQSGVPLKGSRAETYLRNRGILGGLPKALRYLPDCWHLSAKRHPALLTRIDGAEGFAVHRTYLSETGLEKAKIAPNKMMLGCAKGGAIRLSENNGPLVVAEGIETALSLTSGLIKEPVRLWAALSAGGMKALRLPETPGKLIVAADGDPVGCNAAEALAERAYGLGWQVSLLPAPRGCDWNDVLTGKAQAA